MPPRLGLSVHIVSNAWAGKGIYKFQKIRAMNFESAITLVQRSQDGLHTPSLARDFLQPCLHQMLDVCIL
jgi:hypothetical protein